jgi:hypothetical protein
MLCLCTRCRAVLRTFVQKQKKPVDLLFIWDATHGGARCRDPPTRRLPGHCTLGGTTPISGVRHSAGRRGQLKGKSYYLSRVGWVLVQGDAHSYKMMSNIAGGVSGWKYWSMVRKCSPISRAFAAMLTFTTGCAHV